MTVSGERSNKITPARHGLSVSGAAQLPNGVQLKKIRRRPRHLTPTRIRYSLAAARARRGRFRPASSRGGAFRSYDRFRGRFAQGAEPSSGPAVHAARLLSTRLRFFALSQLDGREMTASCVPRSRFRLLSARTEKKT